MILLERNVITASFFDRSIRVVCVVWFTSFLLPCDTAVAQGDVATTSGSKVAQVNDPESFSVMTWNLEWFYDENPEDNYSKLSKENRRRRAATGIGTVMRSQRALTMRSPPCWQCKKSKTAA